MRTRQAIDPARVLQPAEVRRVLADLRTRAARCPEVFARLVVFRLACCCGLSPGEIAELRMGCVHLAATPRIELDHTKNNLPRTVPLDWDDGTRGDLATWHELRTEQGAKPDDPFVCSVRADTLGRPLNRHQVYRRWRASLRTLGMRGQTLDCHTARHTFVSAALASGVPIEEVQLAAGHESIETTCRYTQTWGRTGPRAPIFEATTLEALTDEPAA